ncbi:hypothetical protein H0H81_003896 [Sphagnurus paluster]|uniref:Uncharacterized protein n=1 Tax=Sphagnurus paluster TaxID=117069 RepID=A0A9P7GM26_9AGAR|nr:hypothetical protein H0H81_003896 [Sphagnurus paluster]
MRPRYLGPLIVISRNYGGAYICCELDGATLHRPVAAFRLIPYLARRRIPLPDSALDIDTKKLRELENTKAIDDEDLPPIFDDDTDHEESEMDNEEDDV